MRVLGPHGLLRLVDLYVPICPCYSTVCIDRVIYVHELYTGTTEFVHGIQSTLMGYSSCDNYNYS